MDDALGEPVGGVHSALLSLGGSLQAGEESRLLPPSTTSRTLGSGMGGTGSGSSDRELESASQLASGRMDPRIWDKGRFVRRKRRRKAGGGEPGARSVTANSQADQDEDEDYVYLKPDEAPRVLLLPQDADGIVVGAGAAPIVIRRRGSGGSNRFFLLPSLLWIACWCAVSTLSIFALILLFWLLMVPITANVENAKGVFYDSRELTFDLGLSVSNPNVERVTINSLDLDMSIVSGLHNGEFRLGRMRTRLSQAVEARENLRVDVPVKYSFVRKDGIELLLRILGEPDYTFKCSGSVDYTELGLRRQLRMVADGVPRESS